MLQLSAQYDKSSVSEFQEIKVLNSYGWSWADLTEIKSVERFPTRPPSNSALVFPVWNMLDLKLVAIQWKDTWHIRHLCHLWNMTTNLLALQVEADLKKDPQMWQCDQPLLCRPPFCGKLSFLEGFSSHKPLTADQRLQQIPQISTALVLAHILVLVFWYLLIFSWGLGDSISVAPQIIQIIWPTVRSLAEGWDPARSSKKLEQCWLQAIDVNLPLPDLPGKNNPFCFRSVWTVQL